MKNKKGKILRVKEGYNPNSSSIGSQIPGILTLMAGSSFATIIILHTFKRVIKIIRTKNKVNSDEK